ncbi:MAG TPA: sigma-54 dependent transcriptional regulator, partial [Verrucomicrobiae bacterium]|nr:sigma-54 dependent transcriptional regulator [Verrucomicrobiae bacterium]
MIKPMLLIVDDEKPTREGLRSALEDKYDVYLAEDAATAVGLLEKERFDILLTDFRLPNEDGMKLIARAKSLSRPPVCILMTAYGSEEVAVEAMRRGADDYIAKGRMQIDELEMRIGRALRHQSLEAENESLRQQLDKKFGMENVIGQSPVMQEVLETVRQVAPSKATVLIQGESGTGKELIARAIHLASGRRGKPLIKVNCAAIPAMLMESEFFGHEQGAFTGATKRRDGRFALAHGGTIFLDEIGELPLDLQPKLLRVIQEAEFEPVGSSQARKVDVRLIAAINR